MAYKVFIDGMAGTAGLELAMLLEARDDIEILKIDEDKRKDIDEKVKFFSAADISFMCLPDDSARETIARVPDGCRVIDTSTAHRTAEGWTYGLAEIGFREEIRKADRVSNPGCHATAFILAARPLVENGLIKADAEIAVTSITEYSGGGKKMIAEYEDEGRDELLKSPAQYALGQEHKHLPEIVKYALLEKAPVFMPVVADYYRGMCVSVPLFDGPGVAKTAEILKDYYKGEKYVEVCEAEGPRIYAADMAGTDGCRIYIHGNDERTIVTSCIDNLGKGAAGAAVQNMDIMLGLDK